MILRDKKGGVGDILLDNAIYIILAVIFTIGMFMFVWQQANGAAVWEQYYVSEIGRVINMAQPGDNINLDVQKATEIAERNRVKNFNDIFSFRNSKNEFCARLSAGRETCIKYYNNVDIVNVEMKLGVPKNVLHFEVREKLR